MANGADGSVIIDTGLDSSGVEVGAKEVERRVNSLCSEVNKFGASLQKSARGYASNIGEILSRDYAQGLEGTLAKLRDLAEAKIPTEEYKRVSDEIEKVNTSLDRLQAKQEKLKAMGADQASIKWQQTQKDIDEATAKLQNYNAILTEAREWKAELMSDQARNEAIAGGPDAWAEYKASIEAVNTEIEENEKLVNATQAALDKLLDKQEQMRAAGADQGSKAWQSNLYDIEQARARLEELEATRERLESSGESHTLGVQTQEYQRLSAEAERLRAALENSEEHISGFSRAMQAVGSAVGVAASGIAHFTGSVLGGFGQAISTAVGHLATLANESARTTFDHLSSAISSAVHGLQSLAMQAGRALLNIGGLAAGFKRLVGSLSSFSSQAQKTTLTSNALVKSLTSIKRLLITRVKRMFISSIFNTVREGLQKLAKFDSEFDKSMSRIKNSAKQLGGNIAVMLGSLIQTIEPIITRIIDLLNTAVTAINKFLAALSGKSTYTAAKKGADDYAKSTDKAAQKQKKLNAELYSFDTLNRQKEKDNDSGIQYETLPLDLPEKLKDWIERLKKAFQAGDWYGIGSILAEGLNSVLETVDNWINNTFRPWAVKWADRIAKLVNGFVDNFNWELLGKTIADGINAVFDALEHLLDGINWLNLGAGIGRAIKSWFDNIEWDRIGRVFAKKWNALINVIKGIVTTPGFWTSIGKSIGTFIKSWFETIDFDAIADVIIAILRGIPETIKAFLAQNPFKGVPEKIYSAVNRVLHEVDWEDLAGTLADLFLTLIDQLRQTLAGIDWPQVFEALRNMVVTISEKLIEWIGGIDWGYIGEVFALGFNSLIGAINEIVSKPGFWEGIGENIANFVKNWFATIDVDALGDLLINVINGAIAALKSFLASDPFKEIGPKIKDLLAKVLSNIDPAALLAMFFLPGLISAVKGLIATHPVMTLAIAAILALGPELGNTLQNMVSNIDFAAVGKAISNGFLWVLNRFSEAIESVDWVALGTAILTGLGEMIQNIDFVAIAEATFHLLGAAFGGLVGLLVPVTQAIWEALKSAWEGVKSYFQGYIDQFGGNIIDGLLEGMLNALANLGQWIVDHIFTPFIEGFMAVFGISSPSTVMAELGGYLIEGLLQGITELWHTITDFFSSALAGLQTMFTNAWEGIKTGAQSAWNGVKTTVTNAFNGAKTALANTAEQVKTTLSNAWGSVKTTAQSAWNGVKTTVTNAFNGAKTAISNTAEQVKTTLSNAWNTVKSNAQTAWDGLKTTVTTTFNGAKTALESTATQLRTGLSNVWEGIKTGAQTAWTNLSTTTSTAFSRLGTSISTAWTNLRTSLGNIQWSNIGQNMVAGLMNGIGGAWQNLVNSVQNLCSGLINRIKNWFGVHSPSTVFAEIGEYLDAGLQEGMKDGEGKLLQTAGNIAEAVTDGMTPDSPNVDMSANGIVDGMQAVLSGLGNIAGIFQTIADTLTAMGGLRTPQIAAGTVVPYKTRIDNRGPSEDDSEGVNAYLLNILNELQALSRSFRDGNDKGDGVIEVNVNGRNLFEIMVEENNRAVRRTGMSPLRT